jgi:hypothetical protein
MDMDHKNLGRGTHVTSTVCVETCGPNIGAKLYVGGNLSEIHKAPLESTTMESIKAWKAVEMEKVAIRSLFLENTIDISTHGYL